MTFNLSSGLKFMASVILIRKGRMASWTKVCELESDARESQP